MKKITACFALGIAVLFLNPTVAHAQTFTFGAAGDYGNGTTFQSTVTAVKAQNPDFQLAVGDLAYTTAEQSWCSTWKNAGYNNIILDSGNHDSGESSSGNINTYAQFCPFTLNTPLTGQYGKQYYFDYPASNPTARFILMSAGLGGSFIGLDTNYKVGSQGYNFVSSTIDDARAKGIKWVVVGTHKNCLSMGTKSCEIGTDLMNLLINKRVDLVLQGHDHNYQRSKQLTCATINTAASPSCIANDGASGQFTKGAGTIFLIDGTGGQGQYTINTSDSEVSYFTTWAGSNINQTFGFNKYTVTPTQISAQFVRSSGGTFTDSFVINSSGGTPPPTPILTPTPIPTPTMSPTPVPTPTKSPSPSPVQSSTPLPSTCPIPTPLPGMGQVTGSVNISATGTYRVWSRIMAAGDSSNSYYLQIDSACPLQIGDLNGMPINSWQWINYQNGATSNVISLNLTAGNHVVKMIGVETGAKLDEIIFAADPACIPTGIGSNCLFNPTNTPSSTSNPTPTSSASSNLPDLIVTGVSWTPTNPQVGNAVTFSATVKNQGTGATPAGTIVGVSFWVDSAATSVNWSDTNTQSLAPGASVTLTANGGPTGSSAWTATLGTHAIKAWVNDVNRFPELSQTNNTLTTQLVISSATPTATPTSTPTPSSTPPPSVCQGADVDVNGTVNIFDYNLLIGNFGKTGTGLQGDIDGNGVVNIFDYNILITNFGKTGC